MSDAYSVIFRVSNPKHRRLGRISVYMIEFEGALRTSEYEVAKVIAESIGGTVVPHATAERMALKRDRRRMGWDHPWILYDLPRPYRETTVSQQA